MSNSFYIPIHSMNLAHYLGSGVIAPSIYIENKNPDIQDGFRNHLLLSSSKFTRDTNCSIEIELNSDEEEPKKISENFYLFDVPLPISRIKGIYFTNEEKKITSNFDITSGTAFIPERLLKVSKEESIDTLELEKVDYQSSEKNWTDVLKRYDQILGGFSIMKISKEHFQNYPTHYFSTLGNINYLFSSILKEQNIEIENSFHFAFTSEGKLKEFYNTIYSDIDYNEVQRYAEKDNVKLEVKNGIVQIDRIPENKQTYLVAILDSYGKGKRKQVDSFISDLISGKFIESKKEGLSLLFGLNKGYKAFRNKYKTQNFEVDIKFSLNSKLDYYTIESVYQSVFNSSSNISSFRYLDQGFAIDKQEEIETAGYVTYQMIDKIIIWKPKVVTPFEKLLEKIAQRVGRWFPSFVEVKKNEIESLFKEDIELFKSSLETELEKKLKSELEQNRINNEEFIRTILDNEKLISQLKSQLEEKETVLEKKFRTELEQNKIKVDELNIEILEKEKKIIQLEEQLNEKLQLKKEEFVYPNESKNPNEQVKLVQEGAGSLFSYNNDNTTREQLEKLSITFLKKMARDLKIPKYSTYTKTTDLIEEILKIKSQ